MEAGLRTVGMTNPDIMHPASLQAISYFLFEDKFQQALWYDKAFEKRSWKQFLRYLVKEEFQFSTK